MNSTRLSQVFVALALCAATGALALFVSGVGAGIVGASGVAAFALWRRTSFERPLDATAVVPPYLVAVAGFYLHLIEEYLGHYAPAISRLFAIGWTDRGFAVVSFALAAILSLTAVGLHHRSRIAGFVAWMFLTSRLAELLIFVFPFLPPSIEPSNPATISRVVPSGAFVQAMPNYFCRTASRYYFAGMYTVALAVIPALYAMRRMWIADREARWQSGEALRSR